jgi:hypothetical protein
MRHRIYGSAVLKREFRCGGSFALGAMFPEEIREKVIFS